MEISYDFRFLSGRMYIQRTTIWTYNNAVCCDFVDASFFDEIFSLHEYFERYAESEGVDFGYGYSVGEEDWTDEKIESTFWL